MNENTQKDNCLQKTEKHKLGNNEKDFWRLQLKDIISFFISIVTVGVAWFALDIVSDVEKEKSIFEVVDFFTPKVSFQSGNIYYDMHNESFFVHLKLSNVGKVPISITPELVAVQIFDRTSDNENNGETSSISQVGTLYRPNDTSRALLAPAVGQEFSIAFPKTVNDYPKNKVNNPPYVCAYMEMEIYPYIEMDRYEKFVPEVSERNFPSLGSAINLVLQSLGTPGDENFDSLFCQKHFQVLVQKKLFDRTNPNMPTKSGEPKLSVCDLKKTLYATTQEMVPLQEEIQTVKVGLRGPFEKQVETIRRVNSSQELKEKLDELDQFTNSKSSKPAKSKRVPGAAESIDPSMLGC